ncbi:hypothetical protein BJ944DRAFT_244638 [Cunninghamella echinulata]|nr:hypothetical protein BJ944DRAFT_244638 [Cunninghamella echinulata]
MKFNEEMDRNDLYILSYKQMKMYLRNYATYISKKKSHRTVKHKLAKSNQKPDARAAARQAATAMSKEAKVCRSSYKEDLNFY